jgi:hypothetical protein
LIDPPQSVYNSAAIHYCLLSPTPISTCDSYTCTHARNVMLRLLLSIGGWGSRGSSRISHTRWARKRCARVGLDAMSTTP